MFLLDCTLRDGGYYNSWDFPQEIVAKYLLAMKAAGIDAVELGLRSLKNDGFKGAAAYSTDEWIKSLEVPKDIQVAVMVNAAELVADKPLTQVLEALFPNSANNSPVDIVRIACHVHEFEEALPAATWLKDQGYQVGFNLMQVAERNQSEVEALSKAASRYELDVLYFADSMGSMNPAKTAEIIGWLKTHWSGNLGIHTHDNMGLALANTLTAVEQGVTWLDATVTGMGRGPGNARTEELVIEAAALRGENLNLTPLMELISFYFKPLKNECGWGSNPYYYLSGKYGIHPTFIQEMLADSRFSEAEVLGAIDHLRTEGGKKFSFSTLNSSIHPYHGDLQVGTWEPKSKLSGKNILILGAGPSLQAHSAAIELFIKKYKPVVIGMNTETGIAQGLIDLRVASHPVRLLADCEAHSLLPQPLVVPYKVLPKDIKAALKNKEVLDFGLHVEEGVFEFGANVATIPNSLVISYALAIAESGEAESIYMAGFDGFGYADARTTEMQKVLKLFSEISDREIVSITPTQYDINTMSVYGL
ncbi:aldolase [Shewanella algae]|uniref:aldolase n=1 Tax=Shewanella algae TaxID=38313 RepID=UPI0031F58FAE